MSERSLDGIALRLAEMRAAGSFATDVTSSTSTHENDFVISSIGLLAELEDSLRNSQKALLCRNISIVEHETREQWRLQQALAELWSKSSGLTVSLRSHLHQSSAALSAELRAAQLRVQHLAQVHLTLLGRARRSLQVVCHLMEGPSAGYGPPAGMHSSRPISWRPANKAEKGPSCRA
jgi:hypothetical protein